jgi:hypothetical protein
MGIQGMFADDRLQIPLRKVLAVGVKWMVTAILIAGVIFCLVVSILTFLAGLFPSAETLASGNNQPAYRAPIG